MVGLWQSISLQSVPSFLFSFSLCEVLTYHLPLSSVRCLQRRGTVWWEIIFVFCIFLCFCTIPNPFALDLRIRSFSFSQLLAKLQCQKQMHIVLFQFLWAEAWSEQEFLYCALESLCLTFPAGFLSKFQRHLGLLGLQDQERPTYI